ncbi:hypothetical protein LOK74_02515 [Brevibacillus humidisoli]|uniref:hypothetical protein n=1 Tax=Brevibacillus humidisoli TaxID=2895522 RepID=UPI001E3DC25D|nr:hypothetical protein [Brevibacillus humidisoli]UFJ41429.1 hypothetical protein LOK74_02515 [Brevibacillus humidisoli]
MSIKFDEYLLLELFESEPIIIDSEAEIYKYQKKDNIGLAIILYFSVYDQYATVRLEHKDIIKPLFEVEINNLRLIDADNEKISLFKQESKEPAIQIIISPSFMLDISL